MKAMQKMKAFKRALALAAVLVMAGTGWAKQGGGPGISGDLSGTRDSVTLSVPVDACTAAVGQTYAVSAYIFQPSGRLFAIGISDPNPTGFTCNPSLAQTVPLTVNAVPGLTFKPGPATLLYKIIVIDSTTTPATVTVVDENGSRVDLH